MVREIAVFLGAEGSSTSLSEPGKVVVYRRAQGSWETDREKEFSISQAKGLRELRLGMSEMVQFLGECRIFVARSATGVPYFELEKAGCSIWEVPGEPEKFLDQVLEDEEQERSAGQSEAPLAIPVPEEIAPGNFYISIKEIQEKNAEVTSKQVLQQYVRSGRFHTLVISCCHVPPWIEVEAVRGGYAIETEQLGKNEFKVKIIKNS